MARILVVEDERSILQLVCEVLGEAGHDVTAAGNGAEALRQIEESGSPDLVVLDMWMPVMNGWQFAEALQARGITVPLVVMTAAREARQRALEIGAVGFIGKPFDVDQFAETVERAVNASQPGGQPGNESDHVMLDQPVASWRRSWASLRALRALVRSRQERPFARAF